LDLRKELLEKMGEDLKKAQSQQKQGVKDIQGEILVLKLSQTKVSKTWRVTSLSYRKLLSLSQNANRVWDLGSDGKTLILKGF
jgi:hypothetical protein